MIRRTARATIVDAFRLFFGRGPRDEWHLQVGGLRGRVLNEWRHGAKLFLNDKEVASNTELIEIAGRKPVLSATVLDDQGIARRVDVFVRAILSVKIRVEVDGKAIAEEFG